MAHALFEYQAKSQGGPCNVWRSCMRRLARYYEAGCDWETVAVGSHLGSPVGLPLCGGWSHRGGGHRTSHVPMLSW